MKILSTHLVAFILLSACASNGEFAKKQRRLTTIQILEEVVGTEELVEISFRDAEKKALGRVVEFDKTTG